MAHRFTIGVEEEFQIIDPETLELRSHVVQLLSSAAARGVGDLGLDPRKCPKPSVICIVDTIQLWPQDRYDKGLVALTAATPIHHRESLSPRIKSLNYLSHILAKVEGIAAGVDEVIMLDAQGYVAEASGMNLFAVTNGTLKTPPAYAGILRGVTRDAVIELAREATYGVEEVPLNRYDRSTFYGGDGRGYIDYPVHADMATV